MKSLRWLSLVVALFSATFSFAQGTSTLTGQVSASDSVTWNYATWIMSLDSPSGPYVNACGGSNTFNVSGQLDATGNFQSNTVIQNACISPPSSTYQIAICPIANSPCQTVHAITVVGSSFNLGTYLHTRLTIPTVDISAITSPTTVPVAYSTSQIVKPNPGTMVYIGGTTYQCWNFATSAWAACNTGGGSGGVNAGLVSLPALYNTTATVAGTTDPRNGGTVIAPITSVKEVYIPSLPFPTSGITSGQAFGDSITNGVGVSGGTGSAPYNSNSYAYGIFVNALGLTPATTYINTAIGADQICDISIKSFNNANPVVGDGSFRTLMGMLNDADVGGIGAYQNTAMACDLAAITNMIIPSSQKANGGNTTPGTNWSVDSTYAAQSFLTTSTVSAVQVFNVTTTVGQPEMYVWYRCGDTGSTYNGAPFSTQIDALTAINFSGTTNPPMATFNGASQSICGADIGKPGGGVGAHTVTVRQLNTGTTSVAIGYGPDANGSLPLWVGGVTKNGCDNQGVATSTYNDMQRKLITSLRQLGFVGVQFIDTRNWWTSAPSTMFVTTCGEHHPNNAGHASLAAAFINNTAQPPSLSYVSPNNPANRIITSATNCKISFTDDMITFFIAGTTAVSCTLPPVNIFTPNHLWQLTNEGGAPITFAATFANPANGNILTYQLQGRSSASLMYGADNVTFNVTGSGTPLCHTVATGTYTVTNFDSCIYTGNAGTTTITLSATQIPGYSIPIINAGTGNVVIVSASGSANGANIPTKTNAIAYSNGLGEYSMNPGIITTTGTPTFTPSANITSTTCNVTACNNQHGQIGIVTGVGFTTGVAVTITFNGTLSKVPNCMISQNGGTSYLNLSHSSPSTTTFNIAILASSPSATVVVDYDCSQN